MEISFVSTILSFGMGLFSFIMLSLVNLDAQVLQFCDIHVNYFINDLLLCIFFVLSFQSSYKWVTGCPKLLL